MMRVARSIDDENRRRGPSSRARQAPRPRTWGPFAGGREQSPRRRGASDIAKGFFIRPGQATEHKLGTKLREKGGPRCLPRPTNIYPYSPFSPMLVNCCAGSRNSTHIGRRSLPSASQQPDEPQMVRPRAHEDRTNRRVGREFR